MRGPSIASVLALALLAGCFQGGEPFASSPGAVEQIPSSHPTPDELAAPVASSALPALKDPDACPTAPPPVPVPANVVIQDNGTLTLNVPVDVILLGFSQETGTALQQSLTPNPVVRTNNGGPPLPMVPTVHYRVRVVSECSSALFREGLQTAPEGRGLLDANRAEASLAGILDDAGVALSHDLPALVFLHLGDDRVGRHSYLYRGENDWADGVEPARVENVRVFGGQWPFLALDLSAKADPPGAYGPQGRDYEKATKLTDPGLVDALRHAALNATLLRLYPDIPYQPSITPCNAYTVLFAVRATALGGHVPAMVDPDEHIHADRLAKELAHVTGKPAFVDVTTLVLPTDDPELDVLTRALTTATTAWNHNGLAGFLGLPGVSDPADVGGQLLSLTIQLLGQWVDRNWDRYWVAHPGCQGYLGIVVWADAAEYAFDVGFGVGPSPAGHSWMVGSLGVYHRLAEDPGPVRVLGEDPTIGTYQDGDGLVAHEFGHLVGLHHPHSSPGHPDDFSFSAAIDVMSYPWTKKTATFGAIDAATLPRNEVGFALQAVGGDGPALSLAREALGLWDWSLALEHLRPAMGASA